MANDRKERHEAIEMRFSKPTKVTEVRFAGNFFEMISDGEIVRPEVSSYVKFHERDSGKNKITMRIDIDRPTFDISSFPGSINMIIILDTNTRGNRSAAVAAFHSVNRIQDGYELNHMGILFCKFVNRTEIHSEGVAMDSLFKDIRAGRNKYTLKDDKILVVTDRDLGRLERLNRREEPMIKNDATSYLPESVILAYASSDKKNDSLFNAMIHECDRIASNLIKEWELQ